MRACVNLGCSDDLIPNWVNVDQSRPDVVPDGISFIEADLANAWPFPDSSVDELRAYDVFEHVENESFRADKGAIWCMNEAHRVLKPDGILDLIVPCLPGSAPFVDPTHVQRWCADWRYYFDRRWDNPRGERGRLGKAYRITALFRTVGGKSGPDWDPIAYALDAPDRRKLFLRLQAVK